MQFEDLKIIEPILKALHDKGYEIPTSIQSQAIPYILNRRDILGCAQTGTGKTAAFAVPIIQLIHQIEGNHQGSPEIRALIVTPTRELAIQIDENIHTYGKYTKVRHAVIYGGVSQGPQVNKLKHGVHILVATPGRLLDLIGQGFVNLDTIKLFVLDEADRMLDMGFINDIKKLLKLLPAKRQSLFFSATMPENIIKLSHNILKNPQKVEATPDSTTAETVSQFLYYTNRTTKNDLLLHILNNKDIDQALIFTRTKRGADRVTKLLKKNNVNAASIHGDKAQNQRQKALTQFKSGQLRIMVATNIAARGIDINKLKYVINYEIPNEPESYVHRIGRSGRAGEEGISISLCEPEENEYVREIQKLINQKIEVVKDNPFPQTDKPMTETEKKEWNKEKQRRKEEFFTNRNKKSSDSPNNRQSHKTKNKEKSLPKASKPSTSQKREKPERDVSTSSERKPKRNTFKRRNTSSPNLEKKLKWPLEK